MEKDNFVVILAYLSVKLITQQYLVTYFLLDLQHSLDGKCWLLLQIKFNILKINEIKKYRFIYLCRYQYNFLIYFTFFDDSMLNKRSWFYITKKLK